MEAPGIADRPSDQSATVTTEESVVLGASLRLCRAFVSRRLHARPTNKKLMAEKRKAEIDIPLSV